ncbi:MAG TPA: CRISPR-associated protein Cas4 [Verrucomicrobiota bacterium]|nr:CRISPR-associated protein Cas4 [Verrucomicrobiota bacterium]
MFDEDDLLPISALQHLAYCERQWALIHVESTWTENVLTVEGRHLHARVHEVDPEQRGSVRVARGLRLRSLAFGLSGQADVVEFHRLEGDEAAGASLPGVNGRWRPFPVEYKRGRPKRGNCDEVQLCAQALCLEEMLQAEVPAGALFYGRTRRRVEVRFQAGLREATLGLTRRLHELAGAAHTPAASFGPRCRRCSLIDRCLPRATSHRSVARYLSGAIPDPKGDGQ